MRIRKHIITFSLMLLFIISSGFLSLFAQQKNYEGDEKYARYLFLGGDYVNALKEYEILLRKDTANLEYLYPLGICYLHTYIDRPRSIRLLEYVTSQTDFDSEAMYQLGLAYMIFHRFDEAIEAFGKFKKLLAGAADPNVIPADREIEMCRNAIQAIQKPVNVTIENAGARVNSPYPDFNPYVTRNENTLYYTSKRSGNIGNLLDYDGYYTSDVFVSENKYGTWEKAKRLSSVVNTPLVEETSGMSADGSVLFVFLDNLNVKFQTQMAVKQGKSFQKILPMGNNVNPPNKGANAIAIFPDKKTIIFSSAIEGGQGGSDLYMSRLLPSGLWGPAENLGRVVNTKYDEDYPWLTADGSTLYFSSTGHNSMGGYDLFRSDWDKEKNAWSAPVNLGYPVNNTEDNTTISVTSSGRFAYVSTYRSDSYGNLDIYRVTFNNIKPSFTTIRGSLIGRDSVSIVRSFAKKVSRTIDSIAAITDSAYLVTHPLGDSLINTLKNRLIVLRQKLADGPGAVITITHSQSGNKVGTYRPNPANGDFIAILTPGEFLIEIKTDGYTTLTEKIKIEDREMAIREVTRPFILDTK